MAERRSLRLLPALLAAAFATFGATPANAEFNSVDFGLGRDLDGKLLHGYPLDQNTYYGPFTFGLLLRNRGGERSVRIEIDGSVSHERTVRLPAHDSVRTFFYLPARYAYYSQSLEVRVTDLATGRSRSLRAEAKDAREWSFARLGAISTALNVDKPWTLAGALDAHMPDDWRGLSGVRAIVIEHAYALAHPPDWKVLSDWVAMGGLLLIATPASALAEPPPWSASGQSTPLPFSAPPVETTAGIMQRVGLGTIARVLPEQLAKVDGGFLNQLDVCQNCGWSVNSAEMMPYGNTNSARARLRNVVHGPSWRLFSLLAMFAVAVGPAGWLAFVSRRGQPLRYVVFALGSALVASVIVVSDDLIENGIHARCAASSAIFVDQRADTEIGVEDVALYAPTRGGSGLSAPLAVQLLLTPYVSDDRETTRVEFDAEHMRVRGAVPVRQRRVVAARWLQPARKRLEVQASGGELWAENQLGRDLSSLVLWHAGQAYRTGKLTRGARAQARAISDAEANTALPPPAAAPAVTAAAALVRSITAGDFGSDRFAATYAWTPAQSMLIAGDTRATPGSDHVIAGVYQ